MRKILFFTAFFVLFLFASDDEFKDAVRAFNENDCQKSSQIYKKLAEQNHPKAAFNYAWMFEKGQCVNQDYKEARKFYEIALNGDDIGSKRLAAYRLGLLLFTKRGGDESNENERAIKLWQLSHELGYAQAAMGLGTIYLQGIIIKKDENLARDYFNIACKAKIKEACMILSNLNP
ncbi:tetratricopeptide repeat protein [Campylobacter gastrosuis]|uniref:beta-lactamase n=1 Tax=Campylobacter gastrosuis TaxID=2974576 RepID=A0ABT7HLS9_9BACT|nr:tetratricopeptide repeat protein [Campylobacter gastrosuis]MDL0087921.1 sel1 repeat family protein [Campylobacter gastrosuis]